MANPWQEAAGYMKQAGIGSLGDTTPNFYPSQEQVDRANYGQASWDAQTWNRPSFQKPPDADENWHQNRGPWLSSEVSEMINPSVAERQFGLNAYPGAAKNWARTYNQGFDNYRFNSPKDMRDTMNWARAKDLLYSTKPSWEEYGMYDTLDSPSIMDELYGASETSEDFIDQAFRSKYEDINDLIQDETRTLDESRQLMNNASDMIDYGRENPFLIEDDGGWTVRGPGEIAAGYAAAYADSPLTTRLNETYPDEQFLPSPYTPPSDRQPNLFTQEQTMPALPPENIGMDRAPNEALSEIFGSYQPPIDPTQEYYEDPIMTLGREDLEKNAQYRTAGGTTNNMAGELIRNGIDTQGLNSDEIIQLYNLNFGNPDADVDQFGIAGVDEDNAAVRQMIKKGFTMEEIMKTMAARPVSA